MMRVRFILENDEEAPKAEFTLPHVPRKGELVEVVGWPGGEQEAREVKRVTYLVNGDNGIYAQVELGAPQAVAGAGPTDD